MEENGRKRGRATMDARRALQRILDKNERITPHERGDFGRYNAMRCDAAPARSASLSVTKRRKDRLKLSRGGENLKERLLSPSLSPAFVLPKRLDFMAAAPPVSFPRTELQLEAAAKDVLFP